MRIALRFTLTLLAAFVALAQPAQAHEIGIRGSTGSENLCTEGSLSEFFAGNFIQFGEPTLDSDFSINNNCDVNIFSLDIMLSDDGANTSHDNVEDPFSIAAGSWFDQFMELDDGVFRLFSSAGNCIQSTTTDCEESISIESFSTSSTALSIGPIFEIFTPDSPPGYFQILAFGTEPVSVPEPATLSLLLAGLALGGRRLYRSS